MEPFVCDLRDKLFTLAQALHQHVTARPTARGTDPELAVGAEALPTGTQMSGHSGTKPPRTTGGPVAR